MIDVCREEKLIIAISGKSHQIYMFPTICVEGINAEVTKIEETKGCNMFCIGKLTIISQQTQQSSSSTTTTLSSTSNMSTSTPPSSSAASLLAQQQQTTTTIIHVLCVAIKKVIYVYEISSSLKPKFKRMREIELTMQCQCMQIHNNQLCVGFQSEFALYSLAHEEAPISLLQIDVDRSLEFLSRDPINAFMSVQVANDEYLLVFESKLNLTQYRMHETQVTLYISNLRSWLVCKYKR